MMNNKINEKHKTLDAGTSNVCLTSASVTGNTADRANHVRFFVAYLINNTS